MSVPLPEGTVWKWLETLPWAAAAQGSVVTTAGCLAVLPKILTGKIV